jgi:hypothetical protein
MFSSSSAFLRERREQKIRENPRYRSKVKSTQSNAIQSAEATSGTNTSTNGLKTLTNRSRTEAKTQRRQRDEGAERDWAEEEDGRLGFPSDEIISQGTRGWEKNICSS